MVWKGLARFTLSLLFALFSVLTATQSAAQNRPLINGPVENTSRQILPKSHPLLSQAADLGPLDDGAAMESMILVLRPSSEQQHEIISLVDSQHTKGSPNYHRWLTPAQFGEQFGPAAEDLAAVTKWLGSQGFTISKTGKSGLWIEFSGTAGQVKKAFGTEMHNYQANGNVYTANSSDISIPAALLPVVQGVLSLNNYERRHSMAIAGGQARRNGQGQFVQAGGDAVFPSQNGPFNALAPGDFANIYDLNPLYQGKVGSGVLDGKNQSIAIVSRSDVNLQDISDFRSIFGLPTNPPTILHTGPDVPFNPQNGDAVEATLDVEWAGAIAPQAQVMLVVGGSSLTTDGTDISAAFIVDEDLAPVMSVSFGSCEQNLGSAGNQFFSSLWQQAAAEGMSVFVSTGDSGAAGCDPATPPNTLVVGQGAQFGLAVNGIASTPFNTAVGGTQFNENGDGETPSPGTSNATFWATKDGTNDVSVLGYIPEQVWNESCANPPPPKAGSLCFVPGISFGGTFVLDGTGGGLSTLYPPPSWQRLNVTGLAGSSFSNRAIPDVSLSASGDHDPYLICFNASCEPSNNPVFLLIGGTSAPTPSFAGMMAIIDQAAGGAQGLANYVLYPLAAQENFGGCSSNAAINPAQTSRCVFHDVTLGNNGDPGNDVSNDPTPGATGFPAATGYDPASGLGSVDAANLVTNWLALQEGFQGTTTSLAGPGAAPVTGMHGTPVQFSGQVKADAGTKPPTGSVALVGQGGSLANTVAVGNTSLLTGTSAATFQNFFTGLPGGSYNVVAQYPGDGTFASSRSAPIAVNITPENSNAKLTVFSGGMTSGTGIFHIEYGFDFTILAAVAGVSGQGIATGKVTLTDGGTQLDQPSLDSFGRANWLGCLRAPSFTQDNLPCFAPGMHSLTVSYGGDNSFNASPQPAAPSQTINVMVDKGTLEMDVSLTDAGILVNQPFGLTARLFRTGAAGNMPTGTVQFTEGANQLGQATIDSNGTATIQVTLSQGMHQINAAYAGDGNWNGITQNNVAINVGIPFGIHVPAFTQSVNPGQTATYSLSLVASPGYTAQVQLSCILPATLPPDVACSMPASVTFTSMMTNTPIPVTLTTSTKSMVLPRHTPGEPGNRVRYYTPPVPVVPVLTGALSLAALLALISLFSRLSGHARWKRALYVALPVFVAATLLACGGGGNSGPPPPPPPPPPPAATVNFQVQASPVGANFFDSVTLTLNINP